MGNWDDWSTEDLKKVAELLQGTVAELEFEASSEAIAEAIFRLTAEERNAYLKGTPAERSRLILSKMQ